MVSKIQCVIREKIKGKIDEVFLHFLFNKLGLVIDMKSGIKIWKFSTLELLCGHNKIQIFL